MTRRPAPVLCAATYFALACARGESPPSDTGRARGDSPTSALPATCQVEAATVLTGDGIRDLRVGERVEDVARRCEIVRDTTAPGQEGQTERVVIVDVGDDTVRAVVQDGRIWRLHVRTPAIRAADSVGVGTTGRALRRPGARVLTGEGAVFVTLPTHCGLSFRLRGVQFGRVSSPTQIPDTARVDEVLVIGCASSVTPSLSR